MPSNFSGRTPRRADIYTSKENAYNPNLVLGGLRRSFQKLWLCFHWFPKPSKHYFVWLKTFLVRHLSPFSFPKSNFPNLVHFHIQQSKFYCLSTAFMISFNKVNNFINAFPLSNGALDINKTREERAKSHFPIKHRLINHIMLKNK